MTFKGTSFFRAALLPTLLVGTLSVRSLPAQNPYPPPQQNSYPPAPYPSAPQGQGYPQAPQPYPQGGYYPQPQFISPQQLDPLVGPIALYPDGLLAQVMTASTFANQIPEAANWANAHSYITGDAIGNAIRADNLPWDPSVISLLPFPSVLNYMASNMNWTQQLGNAVLVQRNDVMDAVQRLRQQAYNYGYLRPNQYEQVVYTPGAIQIFPVNAGMYYVPAYDPYVVYARPRPGFFVGGAIRFGPGIVIGTSLAPWGWSNPGFGWREHSILIDRRPWERTWSNRTVYAHPYAARPRFEGPRQERHDDHRGREHR